MSENDLWTWFKTYWTSNTTRELSQSMVPSINQQITATQIIQQQKQREYQISMYEAEKRLLAEQQRGRRVINGWNPEGIPIPFKLTWITKTWELTKEFNMVKIIPEAIQIPPQSYHYAATPFQSQTTISPYTTTNTYPMWVGNVSQFPVSTTCTQIQHEELESEHYFLVVSSCCMGPHEKLVHICKVKPPQALLAASSFFQEPK